MLYKDLVFFFELKFRIFILISIGRPYVKPMWESSDKEIENASCCIHTSQKVSFFVYAHFSYPGLYLKWINFRDFREFWPFS